MTTPAVDSEQAALLSNITRRDMNITTSSWMTTDRFKATSIVINTGTSITVATLDIKHQNFQFNISNDFYHLLQMENSAEATSLIPVTIYLIILMIIGVFGNLVVLYIYMFRFKRSSSRVFILSLAAFDLTTCLLGLPFHVLDLIYPLTFVWDDVCKALSFSLMFTILASIFVLDLIAIDRYRKICKPFKKQLSSTGTKISCWITVLVSVVFAVPMIFIYGSADIDTRIPNITGKECYISNDYIGSEVPMIYDGFNILVFVTSVFLLTGLYIKVGIVVWKRRHIHDTTRNLSKRSNSGTSTPDTAVSQLNTINTDGKVRTVASVHFNKSNKDGNAVQLLNLTSPIFKSPVKNQNSGSSNNSPQLTEREKKLQRKRIKRLMSELSSVSGDEATSVEGFGKSKFTSKKQMRTMRITAMLFIITLIFIISFLPYLIISVMNGLDETFWNNMSNGEFVLINFLLRTYFINNMINPLVYWFLDNKFKQEVHRLFKNIRKCNWSKTFRWDKTYTS